MLKRITGAVVGIRGILLTASLTAAVVGPASGLLVHKLWGGHAARAEVKGLNESIATRDTELLLAKNNVRAERVLRIAADKDREDLTAKLKEREAALTEAYQQTAMHLARIPKDTHTIRVEGEQLSDKLGKNETTAWVNNTWPPELWEHAFGSLGGEEGAAGGAYPVPLAGAYEGPGPE